MAIRKILDLKNNLGENSTVDCYVRVASVTLHKTNARAVLNLLAADQSRLVDQDAIEFIVDETKPNVLAQAYDHIKTMSKYAGAEDC
jgi:hypothetical protein